uniref:Barwin domain-containing protein n=1 Tax=Kwoniella dejecticola CBS 10117 TaxID=1296121 RepID=A0A1A6A455_9TREE|nr:uncharacterized protein I303_04156 [Kwoniella dejecticola CBS 10117]OBR84835.1 hypothetical protein I303_04156 [Kwoniella dejecticola CBS 10117]
MFNKHSLTLISTLAVLVPSIAEASVFSQTDVRLTFYYDIGDKGKCGSSPGDPVAAGWADSSGINAGVTYCEQQRGMSLNQIGTNRIVAFDQDKVWADPAHWCGREVKVYGPDGAELVLPEGPFYIWDSCQNCAGGGKILDVSGEAFVDAKGGTCGGNNPEGFRYDVMDNYIVDPSVGLGGSSGGSGGSLPSSAAPVISPSAAVPTVVPSATPSAPIASSAVVPPVASSAVVPPVASSAPAAPVSSSPVASAVPTQPVSEPSAPEPATTKQGGWGGWGNHRGGHGSQPAASASPIAAIAEPAGSSEATGSNATCKRGRRKRRLARQH